MALLLLLLISYLTLPSSAVRTTPLISGLSRNELIRLYFYDGYCYQSIIYFLHFVHGITISLRHLQRILRRLNLFKRVPYSARLQRIVKDLIAVSMKH